MNHRKAIAIVSLVGLFVALYLSLWKLGFMGPLACGSGSCHEVQLSEHAYVFGIPVAFVGVGGYLALLAVALIGLQPAFLPQRRVTWWLIGLSGGGVAFTAYLSYLEAFVIGAWCRWCLISAAIIGSVFVIALAGLKEPLVRVD